VVICLNNSYRPAVAARLEHMIADQQLGNQILEEAGRGKF
jgi:hypothetical protein